MNQRYRRRSTHGIDGIAPGLRARELVEVRRTISHLLPSDLVMRSHLIEETEPSADEQLHFLVA
jgi:hypothetical protein